MIEAQWVVKYERSLPHRWFWVRVYSSAKDMRRAAARYGPEGLAHFSRANACVQRVWAFHEEDDTEFKNPIYPDNGFAGVIRFNAQDMWTEVVYHELLHAATIVYRMNVAEDIQLGTGVYDSSLADPYDVLANEEELAYIYGQLAADMDKGLREHCDFGNWGRR